MMARLCIASAGMILAAALLFMNPPEGLPPEGHRALALAVFVIPLFVVEIIPLSVAGLLLLLLFVLFRVVPPGVAFSGFTVPALWLVFSAFLLGGGMLRTGLARRVALTIIRMVGTSFSRVILGLLIIGFLLNFFIPSGNARVALLLPIALEIVSAFGLELKTRGAASLVLVTVLSAFFPGFALLTSNVPSLVHLGVIESIGGMSVSYGQWAYLHLPVLGVARLGMIYLAVRLLVWPKEAPVLQKDFLTEDAGRPVSPEERKLTVLLCIAVALWITDAVHGVKPAWIGMAAALAALLPKVGILREKDLPQFANLPLLLYLGSAFGLGTVLAATEVSRWAGEWIFRWIPLTQMGAGNQVAVVALITVFLAILTTHPAIPAILTPIVIAYGTEQGLNVNVLLMAQVLGLGISFFPYQMPPLIAAQGFGAYTNKQALRVMVPFGMMSALLVIPLTILYWKLIGFIP